MAKDARQPIAGWRNEALILPIRVVGLDLTGAAMRVQVRLAPGTPGVPLIDLATVASAAAEGISLKSVSVVDGVPTSSLTLRVNKSTMQGLPASGELGSPTALSYALQIAGTTRLHGAFVVLDSAIDSDNNQANRLPAYGSPAAAFGVADGLTMTIGNDGVTVTIDGAGELAGILRSAKAEADRAVAAAAAAQASQLTAEQKAALAALSASIAQVAANDGGAYLVAIRAAVNGLPAGTLLTLQATSRAVMAAYTGMTAGRQVQLSEAGRAGLFTWSTGDMSAFVAADPDQGLYVAPASDPTGKSGAFVRSVSGNVVFASWWGIVDGHVDTFVDTVGYFGVQGNLPYRASATWQRMDNLLPDGATIMLPAGTMTVAAIVRSGINGLLSRHYRGVKGKTILKATGAARTTGQGMLWLFGSNSDVAGVTFRDLRTTDGQTSAAGIIFAGGVYAEKRGNPTRDIGYWDCTFINMSAPSIVYGSDWSRSDPDGMQRTRGVRIHDNVIRGCDYEYQSIYGAQDVWYYNNDVECDLLPNQPYREFYAFRIIGCRNVYAYSNRLVGPAGYPQNDARAFNIKSAIGPLTEANPPVLNRIASFNVHIYENDVQNWPIFADIAGYVDGVFIRRNVAVNDPLPARADLRTCFINMEDNVDIGVVEVADNTRIFGYDALYYVGGGKVRELSVIRNRLRCAAQTPTVQPSAGWCNINGADVAFLKVIGNVIEFPANRAVTIAFNNTGADFFAQVWGNIGPERSADDNGSTMVGFGGDGVKGKVQTSPGGPLYDATTAPIKSQIPQGTNAFAAAGTWAALIRDPNPTTYP